MIDTAIYVHIPFCYHKCIYCDFYSLTNYKNVESYFNCLANEIEFYARKYSAGRNVISIFFGGGTPSFVNPELLNKILRKTKTEFSVSTKAEITLEANPGTLTESKLESYLNYGFNRMSIGVQSFDDEELKFLTRIHDSKTAVENITLAHNAGFENLSLDLMFNLPKQTKETWLKNLQITAGLPVKHISAYSLILERGTILNKMVLDGKVKMHADDFDADLYETTIDFLGAAGFEQYEVSNFAQPGYECVHNNAYWHYNDYLSFGTSAHSFINGKRWWNYSGLSFYLDAVRTKQNAKIAEEELSITDQQIEFVMLALRSSGLDLREMEKRFGTEWFHLNKQYLETLAENEFITIKNNFIKFTKRGYLICDEILTKFL